MSLNNSLPWDKHSFQREPIKPKKQHFQKFSDETLFYMFYYMPKDSLQIYAADELYKRKWFYNYENCLWFKKSENPNLNNPEYLNEDSKVNSYVYFHSYEWKVMDYKYEELNSTSVISDNDIKKYKNLLNY